MYRYFQVNNLRIVSIKLVAYLAQLVGLYAIVKRVSGEVLIMRLSLKVALLVLLVRPSILQHSLSVRLSVTYGLLNEKQETV